MAETVDDVPLLGLQTMIGFGGQIPGGLSVHPDGQHLIYPVGCTVVIENIQNKKQEFLSGHINNISCLTVSKSGRYIASGQVTYMGFKADIIVWDFHARRPHCKLTLHRNSVEALAFSPNDKYLASLGGQDDGSVVLWNIEKKEAICGSPAQTPTAGLTHAVTFCNNNDDVFITAGKETLRVWTLSLADRKMRPTDIKTGQIKRAFTSIQVSADDEYFYCGSTSGDILAVNMRTQTFLVIGPEKDKFSLGITSLVLLKTGELLVGSGDGTVCIVGGLNEKFRRTKKARKLGKAITSLAVKDQQVYVGTAECNIYKLSVGDLSAKLLQTCHYAGVNDIEFPEGSSDILATCSVEDIRVWNTKTSEELLRITVPNMTCNAVAIMKDGKSIVSGWDDGRIRAFYPESGRIMYVMNNAYGGSVTAVTTTSDCSRVISGSNLGHIVVWQVPQVSSLTDGNTSKPLHVSNHYLLKEHKASVTCIRVRKNDSECITSSIDGSCIIWDLVARCRRQMIRVNTLFKFLSYHPEEHQLLTTGTDRKIGYWETYDASMIRELDGSLSGSVNALDISRDGVYFVSGGDDKLIKVWTYDEGEVTHVGIGHSAPVTGVRISPDQKLIFSVSSDGAILKWTFPHAKK